jgi:N utilization substance protein B
MITRALLRTKAAQVLYAGFLSENDWKTIDNELFFSIGKSYDLYHFLLLLPAEIVKTAQKFINISSKKFIKTEEDLAQNTKLIDNLYSAQLAKNQNLLDYASKNEISWLPHQKEVTRMFNILKNLNFYEKYMNSTENSFENDKQFWHDFYKSDEIFDEIFDIFLEELSMYWVDDISILRNFVIKTIKQHAQNSTKNVLLPLFKDAEDKRFVRELVRCVCDNNRQYNMLIESFLTNWKIERLGKIDIILLKMAIAELKIFPSIPINVTLNEYIEISKFYSTDKSSIFINGILDKVVKKMKEAGTLNKADKEDAADFELN